MIRRVRLYLIAEAMRPEEIHPEVVRKLDRMADVLKGSGAAGQVAGQR